MQVEWDVNPEIIRLFDVISIRYYSLLFISGLLLGLHVVKRLWERDNWQISKLNRLSTFANSFIATIELDARFGTLFTC
jgi:phosphatidylglycerol:prolipoprotein diacylglycerol transferase